MPPLYSIPQSISRSLVIALFGGVVGILGVASYARYTLGRPIRFKMQPDGSLELMSRAEILERRIMQTGRRLESDPESEVYQRMKNVSFTQYQSAWDYSHARGTADVGRCTSVNLRRSWRRTHPRRK